MRGRPPAHRRIPDAAKMPASSTKPLAPQPGAAHLSACSRMCIAASAALRLLTSRCTATQFATRPLPGWRMGVMDTWAVEGRGVGAEHG